MRALGISLLLLSGCATLADTVKEQVSFNSGCPPERIEVVRFSPDKSGAEAIVCGKRRVFRDVMPPGEPGQTWLDVTPKEGES